MADSIKAPETEDELRNDELALDKSHEERKTSLAQRGQELRNKWELAQAKQEMLEKYYDLKGDSRKRELALMNRIGALQARGAGRMVDTGEVDPETGEPILAPASGRGAPKQYRYGSKELEDYSHGLSANKKDYDRHLSEMGMTEPELMSLVEETARHKQAADKAAGKPARPYRYYVQGAGAAVFADHKKKKDAAAQAGGGAWDSISNFFGGSAPKAQDQG